MILKQLEIQGFKSFPDKVKITFDKGVTAVVGPNGSGKSNLSDAIRWVLGETSSRQLRSAGKMEDVIFGGTARRGAMGYASVRLTLDNSDHALGLDAAEVTLGRRYYRAGDSEYTINGQVCRLKDIYELLLDTGIGRDGYSIIGQGRIAEIVAAKGSERREIFEDACGIARFRYRKTDAEHRLAAAEANLERLRDILAELEGRVGPLEKEAEKARVYLELAGRRKSLEVTLWVESIAAARQALQQLQRDYETAQAEYERRDREDAASRQEAEKIRMQAQRLTVEIERLNGDIRSITEQISGSDSRIAVLENDRAHARRSADALREEMARGQTDRNAAQAELTRQQEAADEAPARRSAPVSVGNNVVNMRQGGAQHLRVVLFKPEKFGEETRAIADELVQSSTVVLNMEKAGDDTCRIIDFLSGVAYANNGTVKWVSKNTYIIAPKNVDFTGEVSLDGMDTDNVYM